MAETEEEAADKVHLVYMEHSVVDIVTSWVVVEDYQSSQAWTQALIAYSLCSPQKGRQYSTNSNGYWVAAAVVAFCAFVPHLPVDQPKTELVATKDHLDTYYHFYS